MFKIEEKKFIWNEESSIQTLKYEVCFSINFKLHGIKNNVKMQFSMG
jgi:hypothetical protein